MQSMLEATSLTTPLQKSWFLTKSQIIDLPLVANYTNMTQHGTYKSGPWAMPKFHNAIKQCPLMWRGCKCMSDTKEALRDHTKPHEGKV